MANPISQLGAIGGITGITPPKLPAVTETGAGGEFQSLFKDAVASVEKFQQNSQAGVEGFLNGESEELHQVVLDAQRAELAFEMFLQVRNKVVQAYQEVMRMQI